MKACGFYAAQSACAALCVQQALTATQLCCTAAAHAAGLVNVSVLYTDSVGFALLDTSLPPVEPFEYVAAPQLVGVSPATGHAGLDVTVSVTEAAGAAATITFGGGAGARRTGDDWAHRVFGAKTAARYSGGDDVASSAAPRRASAPP